MPDQPPIYLDIPGEFLTTASLPLVPAVGDTVKHDGRTFFVVHRTIAADCVVLRVSEDAGVAATWGPLATQHDRKLTWEILRAVLSKATDQPA